MGLILGQDRPRMPRTEDQHQVRDLSRVGPEYTIVAPPLAGVLVIAIGVRYLRLGLA
jgi:hypothetical protein